MDFATHHCTFLNRVLAAHAVWCSVASACIAGAAEAQSDYSSRDHFLARFAKISLRQHDVSGNSCDNANAKSRTNVSATLPADSREPKSPVGQSPTQTNPQTKSSGETSDSALTTALKIVSPSKLFDSTSLSLLSHLGWKNAAESLLSGGDDPLPRNVAYVRISRPFLQRFVERQVAHQGPVRDYVLGASVSGHSSTTGMTEIVFVPDQHQLTAELRLKTAVKFDSVADQRPVHIYSRGLTNVVAAKRIAFDGRNFKVSPAVAQAQTQSATTGITSDLWLFNRLSTRIAARKVAEQKTTIDRITADHTAAQVREQFEQATASEVAKIESVLRDQFAAWSTNPAISQFRFACSTTPDVIEIVMTCGDQETSGSREIAAAVGNAVATTTTPPNWSRTPRDIEVFVHSGLVGKFMRDTALQRAIQPILMDLNGRLADKTPTDRSGGNPEKAAEPNSIAYWQNAAEWSLKAPWYAVSWSTASPTQVEATASQQSPAASAEPKFVSTRVAQGD